jgi:hydrogenase nickel incorporation protein HypA/HybF
MHEVSLVRNIFKTLSDEFPPDVMQQLSVVHLKVGQLSNVEPVLMQNAFQAVTETEYPTQSVKLEIETLPVLVHCNICDKTSEVKNYRFVCACERPCGNVVQGNELLISRVEFQSEP